MLEGVGMLANMGILGIQIKPVVDLINFVLLHEI
jgi:hypothetical protein